MDIKNFNPYVRFCSAVYLHSSYPRLAKAYDYRLFYVISGGFTAFFENESIVVNEGGLLIFPPGTAYRLALSECGKSNHIIVNFDFVSDNRGSGTRTLASDGEFKENEVYSFSALPPFDRIFYLNDAYFCSDILLEMCEEKKWEKNGYLEVLSGDMKKLLIKIAREYDSRSVEPKGSGDILCERIKEYIKKEYGQAVSNESIAKRFGYHPYYINSLFKRKTGQTLHSYLLSRRLEYAKELLISSELSISEIGAECGFCSASYFAEVFLKHVGVTPREYRGNVR